MPYKLGSNPRRARILWETEGTWVGRDLQTVMDQLRIGTIRKQASKESGCAGCRQCEHTWNQVEHFAAPTNRVAAAGSAGISTHSPCLSEISHNNFPNYVTDAAGSVCHSSWACPERSKLFWPSVNTQFTTLLFFHKRQTLSRHVSTSSGVGSIIKEGLWGRQALIDFWACAGWWSTLPSDTSPVSGRAATTCLMPARQWHAAARDVGFTPWCEMIGR